MLRVSPRLWMQSREKVLGAFRQSRPHSQQVCLLSEHFWQGASFSSPGQGVWNLASPHLPEPEVAGRWQALVINSVCLPVAVEVRPNPQCLILPLWF